MATNSSSSVLPPVASWSNDAGLEFNSFERLWVAWYAYMQNDVLATGIMTFAMHETIYFGRCLVWAIVDLIPWFQKYKIQQDKAASAKEQWRCFALVLLSHFTVELPEIWLFHPIATYFSMSIGVPFPSAAKILFQVVIFFIIEDAWHYWTYWTHRALHASPFLYRTIHKTHHRYSMPFGLTALYASPFEVMISGAGTVGAPLVWAAVTKDLHILTMYVWIAARLLQAVDAHSGYDFPWSLHYFLPVWAGAEHHDVHHERFVGNYASSFRWWDYLMGTESDFMKEKAQKKESKAGMSWNGGKSPSNGDSWV